MAKSVEPDDESPANFIDPARRSDGSSLRRAYDEIRARAAILLRAERAGHTLQPTALANEAWLRIAHGKPYSWEDSEHFVRTAARRMRQILVDYARSRRTRKRAADRVDLGELDALVGEMESSSYGLVELNDSLRSLGSVDPLAEQIVELRYFGCLTFPEIADVLNTPLRSIERKWHTTRAWLHQELR